MKVSIEYADIARYLRDKTLGHWVAMNVLTEIQIREESPKLDEGTAMMAAREWVWVLKVSETMDKDLRRLDIEVYYNSKEEEPIAVLVGFITMPY
jgi:general secretion pathway protein I